jgi:2-hydroxychromene-2-carboxylate isomerase
MRRLLLLAAVLLAAQPLAGPGLLLKAKGKKPSKTAEKAKVEVVFYIMSRCPFAAQVQQNIKPVLDKMGSFIHFRQEFIVNVKPDGTFESLHGDNEIKGDIAELCMQKHYPENHAFMGAVVCMAQSAQYIPGNWKSCASQNGMDVSKLEPCVEGEEGKKLLLDSAGRSKEAGALGSPTMIIGGEKYTGERETADFEKAVCCAFKKGSRPDACPSKPTCLTHVVVDLVILNDVRCKECQDRADLWTKNFKDRFPKISIKQIDYGTPKGKKLFKKTGVEFLPAYLFSPKVEKDVAYPKIKKWMKPAGGYLMMMTGSTFDPTKEICDNGVDDTKNGKVDCLDDDCKEVLTCRENIPDMIDIFIMSQCPYAIKTVGAMKEVLGNFKMKLGLGLHYSVEKWSEKAASAQSRCIKGGDGMYYCSLHGEEELEEDLRQICAQKYYPKGYQYMDYVWCRNKDIKNPDWKPCAAEARIDAAAIEKCSTAQEGLDLLKADAELAKKLGFTGSPSFLINNKKNAFIKDRSPEKIKEEICYENPGLQGCQNTLPGQPAAGPGDSGADH